MSKVKITLTLDKNLVYKLEQLSKERSKNRSKLIEEVIYKWYQSELEQDLIEGYLSMAKEDKLTAEKILPVALETLHD